MWIEGWKYVIRERIHKGLRKNPNLPRYIEEESQSSLEKHKIIIKTWMPNLAHKPDLK
jgi:hypothetical protein